MTGITIGDVTTRNRVFLAPMSGVTDEPFRVLAHEFGAGLVISEMVASAELVKARPDMVRRAAGAQSLQPFVVQLAGREAHWMAEGARLAQDLGADIVDINMGCPAREVTGGLSGSALMRDLDHAQSLIAATVQAARVPVTLKMRLGWDENQLNAPELARRAEGEGVAAITVHGRTRCQFYKGRADWKAIHPVKQVVSVPVVANGNGETLADVREMLALSGADAVMIGRGAYGRPWHPAVLAEALDVSSGCAEPSLAMQGKAVCRHYEAMIGHYGAPHGVRVARKHLGWYLARLAESGALSTVEAAAWRQRLVTEASPGSVLALLGELYDGLNGHAREAA